MTEIKYDDKSVLLKAGIAALILLAVFLFVGILNGIKNHKYIGSGMQSTNTIAVNGQGSIERAPDTARVTFSVRQESKTLVEAQDMVTKKIDAMKEALETLGIRSADISTENYNSYPQYTYTNGRAPVLRGYEVSHTVVVKIKNLELVEGVIGALASNGVTDLQGPSFGFDDDKAVLREARELAIADAKAQAEKLAQDLGVKLVRIVSFDEQGGVGIPMVRQMASMAKNEMAADGASAPSLIVGDREITSNVTIIYEIR